MKPHYKKPADIRVGVVGYGGAFNMGRQHLLQMQACGMTPVAVAEPDASRLPVAEQDFPGIETYPSVTEMLAKSQVDLIVLITPHNTHAPLALECLKAGRHVVCEKPLAITTAEVDSMIKAAKKSGVMLSTYHNRHWDGRILEATKRILQKDAIGKVIRIECHMGNYAQPGDWWRSSKTVSGGILYDWGVHLLEYSLQLIDARVTEVSGFAHNGFWAPKNKWKDDTNEDEALAVVRFDSGQWLNLTITHLDSKPKEGWVEITGTKGTYLMDGATSRIYKTTASGKTITEFKNPDDLGHLYYENVVDHLVKGADLVITPEWSRRPIHILDLAVQSAIQNKTLKAKYG